MQDDDARIDARIRALRRESGEAATQLPPAIVHAYLTGRATAKERSLVRQALVESPQFRQELVDLSNYLESLAAEGAATAYDEAAAPPIEARGFAPARAAQATGFWERITAAAQSMFSVPRLVPSMAVTALLAFVILGVAPRVSWSPMVAPSLSTSMDPTTFTKPRVPRGGGEGFRSHEEAAEYALHGCLRLGKAGMELVPGMSVQLDPTRPLVTLQLVGRWKRKLQVVHVPLPEALESAASPADLDLRVWVAALPRNADEPIGLRSFLPSDPKIVLAWDADAAERGILVVTYGTEGSFHAASCLPFDLGPQ